MKTDFVKDRETIALKEHHRGKVEIYLPYYDEMERQLDVEDMFFQSGYIELDSLEMMIFEGYEIKIDGCLVGDVDEIINLLSPNVA